MKELQTLITEIAANYGEQLKHKTSQGVELPNIKINNLYKWALNKLSNKSHEDIEYFKWALMEGFKPTSTSPCPGVHDMQEAYNLCFNDNRPFTQEKYIPLSELRPQIEDKSLDNIEQVEFEMMEYLKYEQSIMGNPRRNDILFKRYGWVGNFKAQSWKGKIAFKKNYSSEMMDRINWPNEYEEFTE